MVNFLTTIEAYKRENVAAAKRARPLFALERAVRAAPAPRGFRDALARRSAASGPALIAELKRASPSKGLIRANYDPTRLAQAYERGGAACVSVLTDGRTFQGRPVDLTLARAAISLPVLCKDFFYDPYQVLEARVLGADCILIILSVVDDATAAALEDASSAVGMDVLVEIHDEAELERARRLRTRLIGINNRDHHSFVTTLAVTERLAPLVPRDYLLVSESGISTPADVACVRKAGVSAMLVGESLLRSTDVESAVRMLVAGTTGRAPSLGPAP